VDTYNQFLKDKEKEKQAENSKKNFSFINFNLKFSYLNSINFNGFKYNRINVSLYIIN
jgi:hypothetical protein